MITFTGAKNFERIFNLKNDKDHASWLCHQHFKTYFNFGSKNLINFMMRVKILKILTQNKV
jgi:hypothetical protein